MKYLPDLAKLTEASYLWSTNHLVAMFIRCLSYMYSNSIDPYKSPLPRGFCGSRSEACKLYELAESIRTKGYLINESYTPIICRKLDGLIVIVNGHHRVAVLKYFQKSIPVVLLEVIHADS